jgi:hypothetical protein
MSTYFALLLRNGNKIKTAQCYSPRINRTGPNSPEWAEAAAFESYSKGDFPGVLAAASSSVKATPYLCYLAGAANWALRRIQSARMATMDGLAMKPEEPLLGSLRAQEEALAAEWAPIARAIAQVIEQKLATLG